MHPSLKPQLSFAASASNLRWLAIIRLIVLCGLSLALLYAELSNDDTQLHYLYHTVIIVVYALITLAAFYRLQRNWPVTDTEYFVQLLLDVLIVTVLLYISGGASNPFVSYYLVPLTISAAILPWLYTWIIAGLSLTAYSVMLFYNPSSMVATMDHAIHDNHSFNQHILGMWFNFSLSAGLITYFVVKMAHTLRKQESQLVNNREDELRDEQILAVATLAAGTAHELGTPLSTLTVLVDEMESDYQGNNPLNDDVQLLKQQIASCRNILRNLVSTAEAHSHGQRSESVFDHYLSQILERWQVLRPEAQYRLTRQTHTAAPILAVDATLEQAIANLLNNAFDASQQQVDVDLSWNDGDILLSIRDHGPGIPIEMADQLGKPFVTAKGKGLGLGLFLSHATIARYGGDITLFNHPDGGAVAELRLPRQFTTVKGSL